MTSANLLRVGGVRKGTTWLVDRKDGWKSWTKYAKRFFQIGSGGIQGVLECWWMIAMACAKDMKSESEAFRWFLETTKRPLTPPMRKKTRGWKLCWFWNS